MVEWTHGLVYDKGEIEMGETVVISDKGESDDNDKDAEIAAAVAANDAEHEAEQAAESANEAESAATIADIASEDASRASDNAAEAAVVSAIAAETATNEVEDLRAIAHDLPDRVAEAVARVLAPPPGGETTIEKSEEEPSQVEITKTDTLPRPQHWLEKPLWGKRR